MIHANISVFKNPAKKTLYALTYVFVFFFAYTGFYKFLNIEAFRFNLARTGIYPDSWLLLLPYFVIFLEFSVVLVILFRPKIGVLLFSITMFLFSVYITYLNYTGRYEVCGCGGVLNGLEYSYHILINLIFLVLSILIFIKLNLKS